MLRRLRLICFVIIKIKTNLSDQMSQKPAEESKTNTTISLFANPPKLPEELENAYEPLNDGAFEAAAGIIVAENDPPSFGAAQGAAVVQGAAGGGLGQEASSAGGGSFGGGGLLSYMSGGTPAIWSLKSSPLQSLATSSSNLASSAGSAL